MRRPGIFAPPGPASDPQMMVSWRPGTVTCYYNYLRANSLFDYKAQQPEAQIVVLFQHPLQWRQAMEQSAVQYAQQVAAKWAALRPLDPYVCFANQLNLHYENGDPNANNQPNYETEAFYERVGWWVERTAQVLKDQVPEMKLIAPPFSPGRHEDGTPNEQGEITNPYAGYDYLSEAVETYFDNTLALHAYWGDINGPVRARLHDPQLSSWHAFRWRRVLKLFETRYHLQAKAIITEASNYAAYDLDLFEQITYYSQQTLADPRILGLSYYLWEDPTFSPGNIFNVWTEYILDLPNFVQRLAAQPDIVVKSPLQPAEAAITAPVSAANGPSNGPIIRVSFEDGHIEAMPLETYLRAVVPAEMPADWPAEALKAQAVASRTFALKNMQVARRRNQPADITSTYVRSQQYNPKRRHPAADRAILATKGLALRHNGAVIYGLFSANCGGHTLNNEDARGFTKTPLPYLRGVACPDPGPKFGHAVGLCQHGARVLAEQGRTFAEILAHFYQGTTLDRMPSV